MKQEGLSALVFGATGAIGTCPISKQWAKVHCVVRNQLEEWSTVQGKEKLVVEKFKDLDDYFKRPNDTYQNVSSVFFTMGSQVKHGEDLFVKIDKTYALQAADIAAKNKIPNYQYLSSSMADPSSWFLYLRVKGEAEKNLFTKHIPSIAIHKPGALLNRRNARFGEKVGAWIPFFPKIEATQCARVMRLAAEQQLQGLQKEENSRLVLENDDMLQMGQTLQK